MSTSNDIAWKFRDFYIPEYMMDGLRLWIENGIEPGSFLWSVITNDLKKAVGRADDTNIHNLPAYVAYFYSEAPSECWGSVEKAIAWMRKFDSAAALQEQS